MENIQERLRDARRTGDRALIVQLMQEQEEARNNPVEEEEEEERCGDFYQIDAVSSEFCNGREDPISREVIQDGDGVCIRGNCYSKDSIRESILTNAFIDPITRRRKAFIDPITRSPFTMDSFGYEYHRNMVDTLIARLQEVQTRLDICLGQRTILIADASRSQAEILRMQDNVGIAAVAAIRAAMTGRAEIVRLILAAGGANVVEATNSYGSTVLILAAQSGQADIARLLLAAGADMEATDRDGYTAFIVAAENGDAEIVQLLLDEGVYVNETDNDGNTALIFAANNGHADIVEILLGVGANVEAIDDHRYTALIVAAAHGHAEIVRLLLAAGADTEATNRDGNTASILAERNGHSEIVRLIAQDRGLWRKIVYQKF